jgi:hypothetical protein
MRMADKEDYVRAMADWTRQELESEALELGICENWQLDHYSRNRLADEIAETWASDEVQPQDIDTPDHL